MRRCPYCAEEIQDAAIVCRHCGRELDPDRVAQMHKPTDNGVAEIAPSAPQGPIEQLQPSKSKRIGSLIFFAILIGVIFATLAAVSSVLDILEIGQTAVGDPTAIPILRALERNLAGHFITNLVIYSLIGGLVIWGWRRNKNITLSILGVSAIVVVLLFVFGSGVQEKASFTGGPQSAQQSAPTKDDSNSGFATGTVNPAAPVPDAWSVSHRESVAFNNGMIWDSEFEIWRFEGDHELFFGIVPESTLIVSLTISGDLDPEEALIASNHFGVVLYDLLNDADRYARLDEDIGDVFWDFINSPSSTERYEFNGHTIVLWFDPDDNLIELAVWLSRKL